ncbi:hypothetical protein [Thermoactinospora rubra]|nr:hypothetical protein [Thermoactinospora rubra]
MTDRCRYGLERGAPLPHAFHPVIYYKGVEVARSSLDDLHGLRGDCR